MGIRGDTVSTRSDGELAGGDSPARRELCSADRLKTNKTAAIATISVMAAVPIKALRKVRTNPSPTRSPGVQQPFPRRRAITGTMPALRVLDFEPIRTRGAVNFTIHSAVRDQAAQPYAPDLSWNSNLLPPSLTVAFNSVFSGLE